MALCGHTQPKPEGSLRFTPHPNTAGAKTLSRANHSQGDRHAGGRGPPQSHFNEVQGCFDGSRKLKTVFDV